MPLRGVSGSPGRRRESNPVLRSVLTCSVPSTRRAASFHLSVSRGVRTPAGGAGAQEGASWRASPQRLGALVGDQREEIVAFELVPAVQEAELDEAGDPDHLSDDPLDELRRRRGGTARGEHVV